MGTIANQQYNRPRGLLPAKAVTFSKDACTVAKIALSLCPGAKVGDVAHNGIRLMHG